MPVQFVCPHCAQLLSVGTRKIGTAVECPRCRRTVTVPDQEAAAVSVAMRQSQRASAPESPLPEFLVYDEPPLETDFPVIITDLPKRPAEPLPAEAPRPASRNAPLWQKYIEQGEPVLLLSRRAVFLQAAILAMTAIVAFGLGYLVGSGAAPEKAAGAKAQAGEATLVQGFVRYQAAKNDVRGDAGAVVIALPEARAPAQKLGVQGLRPSDPAPLPGGGVLMSLELLGGATTRVAADGSFNLAVPEPGRYFLLFISNNAQRPEGSKPDEFQLALMQRYFQPAEELIGARKYIWRTEMLPAGATSRSYDFGASGAE